MEKILKSARANYKRGDYFLSATKNLKTALRVKSLHISEIYRGHIVNEDGGIIAIVSRDLNTIVWAQKC